MAREDQSNFRWANIGGLMSKRMKRRSTQQLGVISTNNESKNQKFRKKHLHKYDQYYESEQYDHLPSWDKSVAQKGEYVSIRNRKPRFQFPFAKNLSQRLTAKFLGQSVFPKFKIEESPDDQAFIDAVIRESKIKSAILEPMRRCLNTGSYFLRFKIDRGAVSFEGWDSKYCYPVLLPNGELESIVVQYVYEDEKERDLQGREKKKWYKLELNTQSEILYDNPEYIENEEPNFTEVDRFDHGFGFVQGQWLRTHEDSKDPDGYGLVSDITDFIDEICYSLSQSSQSVSYNQDPILTFNNMNEEEQDGLIRSVMKAWNLGRDGKAQFLESNLSGVERAGELRDKVTQNIGEITRIVMLDPEKIVGSAQSAKAMEVLHAPLKDLIDELRSAMEGQLKSLVLKIGLSILLANKLGIDTPIDIPEGYVPTSFNIVVSWPPIFQQTMEDLQKKVQVVSAAATASLISRETGTRWLAKDFDIEDIEAEIAKIAAQPVLNPFGGF